jgi:hypothetical protein
LKAKAEQQQAEFLDELVGQVQVIVATIAQVRELLDPLRSKRLLRTLRAMLAELSSDAGATNRTGIVLLKMLEENFEKLEHRY